jgi:uncharacterized protein (TIRG00374 family)
LIPAFVAESASYGFLGAKLRRLAGTEAVSLPEATEMGLVVSGLGVLTPASPAEGIAITAAELRRRGLSLRDVTLMFGLSEWFSSRTFLAIASINLLFVAVIEREPLPHLWPLVAVAVSVLALLALTSKATTEPGTVERLSQIIGSLRRRGRRGTSQTRRATGDAWFRDMSTVVGSRRQRAEIITFGAAALLADVTCFWLSLYATGYRVGFDVALLAITVASVATLVPLVPGGIGITEATIPVVTAHFGVPYEQGLAAALAYRLVGTLIPAAVGAGALVDLRRKRVAPIADDVRPIRA